MKTERSKTIAAAAAGLCACAASGLYYHFFTGWNPALYFLSVFLYAAAAGIIALLYAKKRRVLTAAAAACVYTVCFFGITYLINNVVYREVNAKAAAAIVCGINLVFFIIYYAVMSRRKTGSDAPRRCRRVIGAVSFVLSVALTFCSAGNELASVYFRTSYRRIAAPAAGKEIAEMERPLIKNAEFYVSPEGDDAGDGNIVSPFRTIERARDAVRGLDKTGRSGVTVALMAGEYSVDSLVFDAEDGGTEDCPVTYRAYGDGEVVVNGGAVIPSSSLKKVTDEAVLSRLSDGAKEKVLSVDLFALGITAEQYGRLYAIGSYNTASKYDGDYVGGQYCELFIDDQRQTTARYPNEGYLFSGAVVKEGQGRESASARIKEGYDELRNPEPDVYELDRSLAERIASWSTTDGVWIFGYPRYDWADASSPFGTVDFDNMTISPMFVSSYGAKKDAPFYFFNVLEELDAPGEWYLDRDAGVMYFYPPETFGESSVVELSLSEQNIIKAEADHLRFDGLTIKCTRGDAVSVTGDGCSVENCLIKNVGGNALIMRGYGNKACGNEITRTGKGGIILDGGERETLKASENRAENNLIHDWSEIYETYQPAVTLCGVGSVCAHNEIFNSPHEAITYSGNDHLIEYNLIHDVNLKTDDGGAIYSGRRWDWYGTVIRYNLIYDLGADGHRPQGIYMDDALSGQTIYGNVLVNVPGNGFLLGGGRDLDVHDNIVINSPCPISYDERGRSGLSGDESSSFYNHYKENGSVWQLLFDSPWQSEVWQAAYPQYALYSTDFSDPDDPGLAINPAYSTVTRNILISAEGTIGNIADTVYKYSTVEGNALFRTGALKKLFVDPDNGDYTLRDDAPIDFDPDVPGMSEFGRTGA
ncbi:MAG: right-handed parallel beta-helix repeat-containing protein [Clostridia bacterium]|nr:right-handed parallel beta-helix repeat-containing protein [Clostridia bacterium]